MFFLLVLLLVAGPTADASASSTADSAVKVRSSESQHRLQQDSIYSIASTRYTYEWVSGLPSWHNRELSLETFLPVGVFVTNLAQRRRFGRSEFSGDAHYWIELWGESYAHAHASLAPNALTMPQLSLGGEHYEVVNDWELSWWYEWRRYASAEVHVLGPQIGRYLDNWYLRLRTSFIEREGTWAVMQMAAARYYLGSSDSFVEGQMGYGRNVELVAAQPSGALEVVQSYFATARVRHFFTQHLGASFSAKYSDASYRRAGITVGVLARW